MMDHTCIMKYNTHISNVVVVFVFWEESSTITNTPKPIGIPLQHKTYFLLEKPPQTINLYIIKVADVFLLMQGFSCKVFS